jgi:hemerythrin
MLVYPQVALDFMNRDHADFVALRGKLLELLSAQTPAAVVEKLLDELLAHTRHHFAEEEKAMQETCFPPYAMHKCEHDNVLADMSARIELWKQEHDTAVLQDWLDKTVGSWFVSHVGTMDMITAAYVEMNQKAG